jgi:hypothetical protein
MPQRRQRQPPDHLATAVRWPRNQRLPGQDGDARDFENLRPPLDQVGSSHAAREGDIFSPSFAQHHGVVAQEPCIRADDVALPEDFARLDEPGFERLRVRKMDPIGSQRAGKLCIVLKEGCRITRLDQLDERPRSGGIQRPTRSGPYENARAPHSAHDGLKPLDAVSAGFDDQIKPGGLRFCHGGPLEKM